MFDLRQLEVFCRVLEYKSFSKAAEAVYLTQPTVSGHIHALEEFLGTRLFDRTGKTVLPTKAGELLYTYAKRILDLRSEAKRELELFVGRVKGELTIGASTIPGTYILPELIGSFKATHPDIYITLRISDTMGIVKGIVENQAELGIIGARVEDTRLDCRRLIEDELVVVVPPAHKWAKMDMIETGDLKGERFVLREAGSGTRMASLQSLASVNFHLEDINVVAELGSTEAIRQAVKAGLGISIISSRAVKDDIKYGLLHALRLKNLELRRDFFAVTFRTRTLSPIAQSFLDLLFAASSKEKLNGKKGS